MFILSLVICFAGAMLSLVRQYQMLQQNSYFASRYLGWIKGNTAILLLVLRLFLIGLAIFGAFVGENALKGSMLLFAACGLFIGWRGFLSNSSSIKKLVYTARIKRTFAFSGVFVALLAAAAYFTAGLVRDILLCCLVLLVIFPELLCFISLFALKPCEKLIARHYIEDAKRILRSAFDLKVIGITGSYGKTGTKYILTRILSEKYNVLCTPESFNTPMGVVRTIREKMRADTEIFVCEMGAKNVGDIKEICDIVHPDMGLITSVGPQHLETFKSIDNVFKTKFELFDAVSKKGGKVYANGDNEIIRERADDAVVLYGGDSTLSFRAENVKGSRGGSEFDLVLGEETIHVTTKLLGKHSVQNIVGAAAVAYSLGVPAKDIAFAISRLTPTEHRLELKGSVKGSLLIDDAYNANPEGCLEAVKVLSSFSGMQKVIITPGLVELGEKEYECNKALGKAAATVCDKIIFVGLKRSAPLVDGLRETDFDENNMYIAASFKEAMEIYSGFANSNTVVLLENDLPDNYLK
ncbi:MAG: UDP-N-acetylmuramoyl-tripeptide--D-alanyl-D-alanine ligase [Acutalibacteraceae bacterium]|nr:UDP-N-acetylmuramoyl-tripeptide--D-alanyl-D-alanine ligase [Acutalibacteraceae bacterium]